MRLAFGSFDSDADADSADVGGGRRNSGVLAIWIASWQDGVQARSSGKVSR